MMATRRTTRRGFTLIEVLASVAILAIVVPFAMQGSSLALESASVARHRAEAATLGQARLNEMIVTGEWQVSNQGTFAPDFPDYRWQLQTQDRDYVSELLMTVTWKERGQDRSMNLSTFVYLNNGTTPGTNGTGNAAGGTGGAK